MLHSLSHLLCLILPISTYIFLSNGPHDIPGALAWTIPFWIVLLIDWRGPKAIHQTAAMPSILFYDGILYGLCLLQLANIWLMLDYVNKLPWHSYHDIGTGLINLIILRFMVGTSSGTSGIVVAHELIHRSAWPMQQLGRLLLCTVCYDHFFIAHKHGHHLNLGMSDDIATARLGESFKEYWSRVYPGYFRFTWQSERNRLAAVGQPGPFKLLHNQVLQGLAIELLLLALILIFLGWLPALMFLYQALAAVRILEAVNYFQHWGLEEGRFGPSFGWVTDSWMTLYALIGLSNHIGHHENENRHFYEIAYSSQGPKLPYGYFVMNLWVKLNNTSFQRMALNQLRLFQYSQPSASSLASKKY
jgi:alkane 1-monooxygenase